MTKDDEAEGAKSGGLGIWSIVIVIGVVSAIGTLIGQATGSFVYSSQQEPATEATEALDAASAVPPSVTTPQAPAVPTISPAEQMAADLAKQMQRRLPMASGGTMTLFSVQNLGNQLYYQHTIDAYVPPENYDALYQWLDGQAYKSACSVPQLNSYLSVGGILYYDFFIGQQLIRQVQVTSC
jgi:hypothetical protein